MTDTPALEGLGLEEGGGEGGVLPVMQSLLQHLLSKEVLYPSLKEITEKYPEWLRQQRAALPAAQYERYRAQLGVMARICRHLEAEGSEEGAGARTERFEAVLELMQQVGGPGGSPGPPGLNLDLEGLSLPEGGGEQCRLM
uniref:Peroxisomal biogenesis factor 19 n=1 Tax=Cairina moschata TaxID=8855 RepID=A0A8C3GNX9_CAIMO